MVRSRIYELLVSVSRSQPPAISIMPKSPGRAMQSIDSRSSGRSGNLSHSLVVVLKACTSLGVNIPPMSMRISLHATARGRNDKIMDIGSHWNTDICIMIGSIIDLAVLLFKSWKLHPVAAISRLLFWRQHLIMLRIIIISAFGSVRFAYYFLYVRKGGLN